MNFIDKARAMMHPFPIGDPDELERYAVRLDHAADLLAAYGSHLESAIGHAGLIQGPLATRTRHMNSVIVQSASGEIAGETRALAADVRHQAADLRQRQHEWQSMVQQLAHKLEVAAKAH